MHIGICNISIYYTISTLARRIIIILVQSYNLHIIILMLYRV